jgi:hypothetical protein
LSWQKLKFSRRNNAVLDSDKRPRFGLCTALVTHGRGRNYLDRCLFASRIDRHQLASFQDESLFSKATVKADPSLFHVDTSGTSISYLSTNFSFTVLVGNPAGMEA